MKISSEGYATILLVNVFVVAVLIASVLMASLAMSMLLAVVVLLDVLVIYFFRDPTRAIPKDQDLILSPADGKVVLVRDVVESEFIKGPACQVSIFLSVFNVHVNRVPITGTVSHVQYRRGRFLAAFKDEASLRNEQTVIGISNDRCKLVFKQIAGLLARRIVCHLQAGSQVKAGERFGIIKFGSRVDLIFPPNVDLMVRVGDKVHGGSTILGRIRTAQSGA